MKRRRLWAAGAGVLLGLAATAATKDARAFAHVVRAGEALAQIAERLYGDSRLEAVLVGANALDVQGGSSITPGMRIEIPAPGHHTVSLGETWPDLAVRWLGASIGPRIEMLVRANRAVAWSQPVEGQEIEIPAVLTYIASEGDNVDSLADRFWGHSYLGWQINDYNQRNGVTVRRGEVLLIAMPNLRLTDAGKAEARAAAERDGASGDTAFERQRKAEAELPGLLADVRYGRYIEAVARGNALLGGGALTRPQFAAVYRSLLESYVALGAQGAAASACAAWKANEASPVLDPVRVSPKIRAACSAR